MANTLHTMDYCPVLRGLASVFLVPVAHGFSPSVVVLANSGDDAMKKIP